MTTTLLISDYLTRDLRSGYAQRIIACGTTVKYGRRTLCADVVLARGIVVRYYEQSHVLTYGEVSDEVSEERQA